MGLSINNVSMDYFLRGVDAAKPKNAPPAAAPAQGNVGQPVDTTAANAGKLVSQLDVLLVKAAKASTKGVDGILVTKAGATKEQIARLTNGQLVGFVKDLCKSGDAQEVKDDIADATGLKDVPPPKSQKVAGNAGEGAKLTPQMAIAEFEAVPENDKDIMKECAFRSHAREILIAKTEVLDVQIAKLTNRELKNFLETLMETKDPLFVKQAITMTVMDKEEAKAKPAQPQSGAIDINAIDN